MTILCGTDFSGPATEALTTAALIAARLGEPLALLHVAEAPEQLTEGGLRHEEAAKIPVRVHLTSAAVRARELGARVQEELVTGNAAEVLANKAATAEMRLVVVSSLGRRAPARWLLGSVAERLAQTSSAPVLVVRDSAPFGSWLRDERPLKVMVAADDSVSSDAALRWIHQLRCIGPCDVTVARIARPFGDQDRIGVTAPVDFEEVHPDVRGTMVRDLKAKLGQLDGRGELHFVVRQGFGDADCHLVRLAEELGVHLLVVGTHQRSTSARLWHGSVSRGVLHLAPMSVLSVAVPTDGIRAGEERPIPVLQQVLVATDLSETGNRSLPWALSLLPNGGTVHLIHVLAPAIGQTPVTSVVSPRRGTPEEWGQGQTVQETRAQLERLVPEDAAARGVRVVVDVLEGPVADEVCRAAERLGVDAICMGSQGRTGIAAAVLGSVARKVLAQSRRPVLVVGPQER